MRRNVDKIARGSFASVIHAYLNSPTFRDKAHNTRRNYLAALRRAEAPELLGAIPVHLLRPAIIQAYLDGMAEHPAKANKARTAIKAVERWAIVRDLIPWPISTGTQTPKSKGGRRPWTDAQVELAEKHARPDLARVVTLAANTGQRCSDLVKMRWSDFEEYAGRWGINVAQKKTGLKIWIPLTREFAAQVETWERRPTYIALQANGLPWTPERLSVYWNTERQENAALAELLSAGCVLHGLRATAVVRLRRAGANPAQIADMVGMSVPMVDRYCRFASQRENALAAVHFLDARTPGERSLLNIPKNPSASG